MRRYSWIRVAAVILAPLAVAARAEAHCDSMDGPVVAAARQALTIGNVAPALAWVRPADEAEIRAAFDRTREVRSMGGAAAELAEIWFFETVVRVHRLGEGEPYTGLKPAGSEVPPGIAAAERAIETNSTEDLGSWLGRDLTRAIEDRFGRVRALAGRDPLDVEAGRRYVAAYTEFVHFVEDLRLRMEHTAHGEGGPREVAHEH